MNRKIDYPALYRRIELQMKAEMPIVRDSMPFAGRHSADVRQALDSLIKTRLLQSLNVLEHPELDMKDAFTAFTSAIGVNAKDIDASRIIEKASAIIDKHIVQSYGIAADGEEVAQTAVGRIEASRQDTGPIVK